VFIALSLTAGTPSLTLADHRSNAESFDTSTPIKPHRCHLSGKRIFRPLLRNLSLCSEPGGEPKFKAQDDTPAVDGLLAGGLLDQNPNSVKPFRLDRSQAVTCDPESQLSAEQLAFNHGLI